MAKARTCVKYSELSEKILNEEETKIKRLREEGILGAIPSKLYKKIHDRLLKETGEEHSFDSIAIKMHDLRKGISAYSKPKLKPISKEKKSCEFQTMMKMLTEIVINLSDVSAKVNKIYSDLVG